MCEAVAQKKKSPVQMFVASVYNVKVGVSWGCPGLNPNNPRARKPQNPAGYRS